MGHLVTIPHRRSLSPLVRDHERHHRSHPKTSVGAMGALQRAVGPYGVLLHPFRGVLDVVRIVGPIGLHGVPLRQGVPLRDRQVPLVPQRVGQVGVALAMHFRFLMWSIFRGSSFSSWGRKKTVAEQCSPPFLSRLDGVSPRLLVSSRLSQVLGYVLLHVLVFGVVRRCRLLREVRSPMLSRANDPMFGRLNVVVRAPTHQEGSLSSPIQDPLASPIVRLVQVASGEGVQFRVDVHLLVRVRHGQYNGRLAFTLIEVCVIACLSKRGA